MASQACVIGAEARLPWPGVTDHLRVDCKGCGSKVLPQGIFIDASAQESARDHAEGLGVEYVGRYLPFPSLGLSVEGYSSAENFAR